MGRKKEEREAKADHKKARRLAKEAAENGEDDSVSLAHQLAPLGKKRTRSETKHRLQWNLMTSSIGSPFINSLIISHYLTGLQVREIPGDGNCLFRAVSDQLEGTCYFSKRRHVNYFRFIVSCRPIVSCISDENFRVHAYKRKFPKPPRIPGQHGRIHEAVSRRLRAFRRG